MSKGSKAAAQENQGTPAEWSLEKLARNISSTHDFVIFMNQIMAKLITGEIDHATANSICKTAAMMLKAVEMQIKFGNAGKGALLLAPVMPQLAGDVTHVTHVTNVTSEAKVPEGTKGYQVVPKKAAKWCSNCYIKRKQYISATEEVEGENLCLPCANAAKE
jgi:hypothetical protein